MRKSLSLSKGTGLLLLFLAALHAPAQKRPIQLEELKSRILKDPRVKEVNISAERGTPSFIILNNRQTKIAKDQAKQALSNYLNVRAGVDDLIASREMPLSGQSGVQEFIQYFKGVKVEYARYASFFKGNAVQFLNGSFYEVPSMLSTKPKLSESEALQFAKATVNAKQYAWEALEIAAAKAANAKQKAALQAELAEYLPNGELVIVKDFTKEGQAEMRLAYKFNIYAFQPLSRNYIYVDAVNGKILLVNSIIKHADNPGTETPLPASVATTVKTRYAGNRTIYTKQVSGTDPNNGQLLVASNPLEVYTPGAPTFSLIDDTKGGGIETYDLNGVGGLPVSLAPAYSTAKAFTDVDNKWTVPEHLRGNTVPAQPNEAENDDIAWDAHWGASVVYDYWKLKQNRLSFDGKDAKIKSYVHSGLAYDNAFWNGRVMTYGDGSYPAKSNGFRPLTSLDVCAHEIGHGVCTFTSDLVYARESGAMNEGFSDIWAACAEYYALKNIDPNLPYKPFYIGEQIAANPAVPLRRMDDPLARNNPDTYGGRRWTNQVGCSPTLANDQCGVHNNSGVLNKWFYLLTVGSGAGSGPDAAFAGVDDGVNDLGNAYNVTGLGFNLSEKIAYITETLLTSTATFEEARQVSIQVATDLSGSPCSHMVKQVTNAWYAVGVGAAFTEPCKVSYGFITQVGSSVSEGNASAGCNGEYEVKIPVLMPAGSTGTMSVSGTAINGQDYRLPSTSLSNTGTTAKAVPISVFIKNDGIVEPDETIKFTITLTNLGSNSINNTYTLNIIDDDVQPVIGIGEKSLLNETFTGLPNGFAEPTGWVEFVGKEGAGPTGENHNQWGVWNGKLMITGKLDITGPELPPGTYNDASPSNTIVRTPLIDARGLSNVTMSFDFRVQGEIDPNGADIEAWGKFDYMEVVYSFDGTTFFPLTIQDGFGQFASAAPKDGKFVGALPAFLGNKQFYLGFKWFDDTNAGGPESVQIDNVSLTGQPRKIENEVGQNGRENLNAGYDVYVYSIQDGELLGRIKNNSTKNYGCTNVYVEKTGVGAFNLYQGRDGLHKVADKILRIEASLIYKLANTVSLYYTEDQLVALENATGQNRIKFSIYRVDAAAYTGATSSNTKRYAATYTALPGVGGYFTISFTEKVNGSYALGYPVSVYGTVTTQSNREITEADATTWKFGRIYPNPGNGVATLAVNVPQTQRISVDVINIAGQVVATRLIQVNAGANQFSLPVDQLIRGTYLIRLRDAGGNVLNSQQYTRQ